MNENPKTFDRIRRSTGSSKIGNSIGLILPKEMIARLNLKEGDKLLSG